MRVHQVAAGVAAAIVGWTLATGSASATVFAIDEFTVVKGISTPTPTTIFDDTFGDNIPPPNSNGGPIPIACNTAPLCYGTGGTFSEAGGRAIRNNEPADAVQGEAGTER